MIPPATAPVVVPGADPQRRLPEEDHAVRAAVDDVLAGAPLVLGRCVEGFESDWGHFLDAADPPAVVGVGNGSDALVLALVALDLPTGSAVLVPANDGGFAGGAARAAHLLPVPVDVAPDTHLVTAETLDRAWRPDAAAAVVTHLHGQPADVVATAAWCRDRGLRLVEDAAQAHGARLAGEPQRSVGTVGDVATFSFYPTKNLGALGDGGAVVTRDRVLAARVRALRQYGWGERFRVDLSGGRNSRLDALQAAVLSARLPWLVDHNRRRREVLLRYRAALGTAAPVLGDAAGAVAHHAVVVTPRRDELAAALAAAGVATTVHYPWLLQEMPGTDPAAAATPVADRLRREKLSLPCFGTLRDDEIELVCDVLRDWAAPSV